MATEQWLRALDKNSGRYYYWNTTTRESRWDIEDHLKPVGDRTKKRTPKDEGRRSEKKQVVVEKEPEDENNTKEKLEARREKAAKEDNRIGLEHMLATIGWAGARSIPTEVITQSIEPYAKPYKFQEEETLAKFFEACKKKLDEDRSEIERLASEADQLVKDAEEAAQKTKMALDGDDSRRQLFEFLTKQTAVQREEEKAAQLAAYRARAEKRAREKEKMDHIGANPDSARSRPRREIKQRFVEKGGFMVLKENTPDESKPKPVYKERKQPPSAYALFSKDFIKEMKENGIKMDFATVQKAIAAKWKTVDENGRAPYYEAAKLERERILAERLADSESPVPDDSQMEVEGSPAPPSEDASGTQTPADEQQMATEFPESGSTNATGTPTKAPEENEAKEAAPPPSITKPEDEESANAIERTDAAEPSETPARAPTSISVLSASQDSMIVENGVVGEEEEEANEEDETRTGAFTPATKDKDDDDDSDSDSDDEDDAAPQLGVQSTNAAARTAAIMVKLPRPALEEICDCALLALGPRSGCSPDEVINWINTSPLGQALKSRLKSNFEDRNVYKSLKRHATRGRYDSLRINYMMSTERLDEIGATDSLAKVRRARREQKGTTSATAVKESVTQMRMAHNEEVKKGVMEAAFARWSYMVRKLSALEPFISENAKNKILRFKELLEMNNFGELARADLDDNLEEWSKILFETRKTLDFHTMGEEAPNFAEELPQPQGIMNGDLRAYQRRGLSWLMRMYQNGCNAVLADEMGLGKTLQTISFLTHLKESGVQGPFLVIVPLSVLTNWANEFRKWSPSLRVVKLHSSNREERDRRKKEVLNNFKDFDAVVTTYEMIVSPNMKNVLTSKLWWRCVVIDEGHKIKNDETSLSQAVRSMNCQYRLLLTGTPLQNNLHELWAMLNFLDPVVFDSSDKFDAGFDLARDIVDRELLAKAHYLLRPFCLRRTKLEVESKLPPKEEIVVNIPLSEMQTFWYKRLILNDAELLERVEDQLKGDLDDGTNPNNNNNSIINGAADDANNPSSINDWKRLQSLMMQLRKCCNHPYLFPGAEPDFDGTTSEDIVDASGKLQMLDRLLKKLQEKGHRVVIFSQFTAMLDILSDFLNLRGYRHARLDGSTNRVQRAVDVLQYNQADSTHFAYLMSTRAGGLGINLATADTVVLYDSDWNPQVDLQAMDRVHRIGQEKPVHVYRLVTKGTVEERIVQRAKKKLYLDSMVNRGSTAQSEALEGLSKAEMLKMLKFGASAVFGESDGEMVKPLTDAELDAMVDRSAEAMKSRQEAAAGDDSMAKGDNALDFEMDKTQNVSLREMYGKDFVQEVMARTGSVSPVNDGNGVLNTPSSSSATAAAAAPAAVAVTTEERPVKRQRGRKRKSEVDPNASLVLPDVSVQDIASDWKKLKAASGGESGASAATEGATKSGRKIKQRFTKVGGYNVLKSNTYSLEDGEKSVFSSELANRRKGPDAATLEEINRSLGRGRQVAGRDYTNEQHCLACWDGGELVLCDQCPVSVHLECLNAAQAPPEKSRGNPTWRCPHHTCVQCERKSAAAGGLLFRCSECLNAYCEDHLPLEGFKLHDDGRCLRFEELGFRKPTQGYYILCSKSCQTFYNDRVEFGSEEAIRRAVDRMSGGDGLGSSSATIAPSSQTKGRKRKAK